MNQHPNLSGYQITEELYIGTRTLVYRGIRTSDQQPIIIKILRNEYPKFNELVQFRNQYTITKNLDFSYIVKPLNLEAYHNSYALVMEDFGGISLSTYRPMATDPSKINQNLPLAEFLQIAIQLTDILNYLYQNRVIHKDIKPANILINPDTKVVKLIDFSISSLLPRETQEIQNPKVLEGTLAYISPEQTGRMNRGIDYRSDFYSLGVTFYELLTGRLPFISTDAMELVHCHLAKQAITIHDINPELPLILSKIISKLMAKNAEGRYQTALGIKHDLEICLEQLQTTGNIQTFKLGERDISDRFTLPEKLYGREQEVKILLQAFERVANPPISPLTKGGHRGVEMMLVAGFSGIGKTAVINEVHKPIVRQRGYFIKGKYDQFQRNIPFSAFVQAFRDLIGQLLSESDLQLQTWKTQILAALGNNGQVLIDVIPELENIIGKQPPATTLSGSAAQNRFNLLMQKFVQVFTRKEHPLVMFLDDWQWADSASMNLLQLLMQDTEYLLILGAYRDREVSPVHPFILTVDEIVKTGAKVNTITLSPLSEVDMNRLVADTLNCELSLAKTLTKLVYQKTKGNPFFATQFLKALYDDRLISFDWNIQHWQCDIAQVKALAITDDVVEFMALQLQKLPIETQDVLKLAACIGAEFDLNTLVIVSEKSTGKTATALWKALQENLVIPTTKIYKFFTQSDSNEVFKASANPTYRFLHDRVQQAAYSLIPEQDRAIVHYQIGQLLLQQIEPEAREERIFALVNQLNYGIALIEDQTERDNLAQLNLLACQKARVATAYQAARKYTELGLNLLGSEAWQRNYQMTLSLHELGAEVASLCGEFEQMNQWIETAICHARTSLEQVNVYTVKIQALTSQNKFLEAISIAQSILKELGVEFPERPTLEDIQQAVQEINASIGDRPIEGLFNLPAMVDAEKLATMQVAASILSACYLVGSPLYSLAIALQVNLSLQYGNSPTSAFSYGIYGALVINLLQDVTAATQFGQLAYRLALEADAKNIRSATFVIIGLSLHHYKYHLRETLPIFQAGYQAGLETGNFEYVGYNAHGFCLSSYCCGQPLAELEFQSRAYRQQLLDFNQLATANYCAIYWETTLFLLGNPDKIELSFEPVANEEKLVSQALASKDLMRVFTFYMCRAMLRFLLGDFALANADIVRARQYIAGGAGRIVAALYFYDSLIALATESYSADELEAQRQRIQENQARLQLWAEYAPMNYLHQWQLVEAEKYRVLGQKAEPLDLYDRAIAGAKENEYIQEEALANELAAKFYLDWGKEKLAALYMQEAYYCYARWGAKAKVVDLEKSYPQLLAPILQQPRAADSFKETLARGTISATNTSSSVSEALDLATLLKASQAISGEIKLNKLLTTLLEIVIANAGASKCVLLLKQDTNFQVVALVVQGEAPQLLPSIPLESSPDIAISLVNNVKRTLSSLVLADARINYQFVGDSYIQKYQPKSVLCSPILNQGQLIGILYLENNLTIGAFTTERVEVLNLICAQAAISLENARLYQAAQQALQDLQQAQLTIVQSEKMSALGHLVAGVAHEINNPVGFLGGNIQPALDYINDLFGLLDLVEKESANLNVTIKEEIEAIELDYIREDLPKLVSSMQEGVKRIQEISTSLRTFSRADTNHPVACNIHDGIDSTIMILKHRLKANENRPEIKVIKDYGDLPQIECYAGQLNQVFMNLLSNAIDAVEESNTGHTYGEINNEITVKTELTSDKKQAVIRIKDNGIGMNADVQSKIFEHLFTTKEVGKGTGLGLAIARQIVVEKHGGSIQVNSILGSGTEFIITLPIKAV
ncbi:ATP-binding sensor histidine kinase [Kamptonema sp. UHCC 0994]|uniref:trifunctional serine/threonine-protein kinase/ATP-binding protein/sensor histidine kinase n=1 Tax=Kamptonema sp. UHCC 0994 TaxID=3031329 RepID=UPI0023B9A4EB|nr:ATP-binding sensor histidine kinase [Kamptonema sp. UHCC 0994]MDF0555159.1 AAA family ATPase [Kamptonema sp. UHCC 0994]